jgi:Na+-driven multidrug efflux pump
LSTTAPQRNPSILQMTGPLVVSFLMRSAFTFVDTAYAATIGDAAVAAVGLTVPFEFLMTAIWVGLSTGLTSALSRAMGAREGAKVEQYLRTTWTLVRWISPAFALVGGSIWFLAPRLGLAADVARAYQIYGTTLIFGSALNSFWSVIPDSIVKAHHDTRSTMWAGIWSNLINVVLNTIFTFVFHWGVFGIAFSTVVGRFGGLTYALNRAKRHEDARKAAAPDLSPGLDPKPYRAILALAIPSSVTFALMAGESGVVNALLAARGHSTEALAAYSIFHRMSLLAMTPVIACGVAMLPFAARRFGERDLAGIRRGLRQAFVATAVYAVVLLAPLLLAVARPLAGALAESPLTAEWTAFCLRLVPLGVLAGAPFLLCRPIFEAMGRWRPGLAVAMLRYLGLTAPAALAGLAGAAALGWPPIEGVVVALIGVAAIASCAFIVWARRALAAAPPAARAA